MKKAFLGLLILLIIASGGLYTFYIQSLKSMEQGDSVIVEIPKGSSTKTIGQVLEKNGLIHNGFTFALYVRKQGKGSQLQAGKYQFTRGESVDQIIDRLVEGDVYVSTTPITIPEGYTVAQIADFLTEKGLVNKEEFLKEVNHGDFPYEFVKQIPKDRATKYRLEGYLFPKTYELREGITAHEIITMMLDQFQQEWDPSWQEKLKSNGLTLHDAITLASIVEREVVVDKERPIVAGVYFNRLAGDIMLQADATIQYALGNQKAKLTYKDLELDSLYNTYKYKGLPPGPIASPGIKSIEAVVQPQKNHYLFYVTKKDGSGEHYFSETYQQHLHNIALSKKQKK
ncbi:endolytic transglycosylase MltG [Ammoniphilus resinae]|uniref:Endolytic murein transglycosylase n=1 Tax=Ammoniphilus resinae TaxID=861532 RepID=A0ABS4GJN1_9BACL|nr:endolytic transglycosylase MltG [Ammoniphilus resinae]MBP1930470.1 UPF0755 protein [Ammoniphilus resinae]